MIPKRTVFHCSGIGSFITAVWLHFYASFLCDSFILTSGLPLTKGHLHCWDCSVAAEDEKKVGFKGKIFRRLLETQVRRGDYLELTRIFLVGKLIQ